MARFRDKASGNIFVFESDYDVKSLRKHPEYEEVIEEVEVVGYTQAEEPLVVKKIKAKSKGE